MFRISSPGEYSLCSANSTDEPCSRDRCRPDSAPSTITRALMGRLRRRARAMGSSGGTLRRDDAEEAIDQIAGAEPLGLGAVVEDQAVLQGRPRQRGDV